MSDNNNDLNRGAEIIVRFLAQELPQSLPYFETTLAKLLTRDLEFIAEELASGELKIRDKNGGELHRQKNWQ